MGVLFSHSIGQDTLKVFLYAGQSNAQGTSKNKKTFSYPQHAADSQVKFAWSLAGGRSVLKNGWDSLKAAPLNATRVSHAGEIEFARQVYAAGIEEVGLIKVTKAGSSIHNAWHPGGSVDKSTPGEMYRELVIFVQSKLADLERLGIPFKMEALFWHQGERDATPNASASYESSLNTFIDSLRVDLGKELQVYLATIYNPKRDSSSVLRIRQAQINLASQKEGVYVVNLDTIYYNADGGLNEQYMFDNIHYSSAGYFKVGEAFAHAYLAMNSSPTRSNLSTDCPRCEVYEFPNLLNELISEKAQITVRNNPSRRSFTINIDLLPYEKGRLSVLSSLGQKVAAYEIRTSQKLQVGENFSQGLYWLVWEGKEYRKSLKLFKIR